MYSASVDDKAISVCIFDAHTMGHPPNVMAYPDLDFAVAGSTGAASLFHSPAWEASTQHSKDVLLGCRMIPLSAVASKYLPMRLTAFVWLLLGSELNLAH